jgi:hypothetical protein
LGALEGRGWRPEERLRVRLRLRGEKKKAEAKAEENPAHYFRA